MRGAPGWLPLPGKYLSPGRAAGLVPGRAGYGGSRAGAGRDTAGPGQSHA